MYIRMYVCMYVCRMYVCIHIFFYATLTELINYTQPVYVWREDPNSRQNTIKEIIERATSKEDWPQVSLTKKTFFVKIKIDKIFFYFN